MSKPTQCDADRVTVSTGGSSPGGDTTEAAAKNSARSHVWRPVLTKALSIAVGMIGLATIGVVSGSPEAKGVDLASVTPGLDGVWLAPARNPESPSVPASANLDAQERVRKHPAETVTEKAESQASAAPSSEAMQEESNGSEAKPPPGITPDGKVILNTASVTELTRLPGVGRKRAEKIVELRERLKRFRKATDLLRVKGIGVKSLRKMLPHLILDPPVEAVQPEK